MYGTPDFIIASKRESGTHLRDMFFVVLLTIFVLPLLAVAADPASCVECHEKEYKLWIGSNHQKAMQHADDKTVLGDFNDVEFVHVGFDDILRLSDADGQVRFAAIDGLRILPDKERYEKLGPLLSDPLRSVRCEAARLLASVPPKTLTDDQQKALTSALAEYVAAQRTTEDQPATHLNLGVLRQNLVQPQLNEAVLWYNASVQEYRSNIQALEEVEATYLNVVRNLTSSIVMSYEQSLKLDPAFIPSRINLAMTYDLRNEPEKAEKEFRTVIEIDPNLGDAWYSLGLLLAQQERLAEAEPVLVRATELLPKHSRLRYNLSVAQFRLGKKADAEKTLQEALELEPSNVEFQQTLEFFRK